MNVRYDIVLFLLEAVALAHALITIPDQLIASLECITTEMMYANAIIVWVTAIAFVELLLAKLEANNRKAVFFGHCVLNWLIVALPLDLLREFHLGPLTSAPVAVSQVILIMKLHSYYLEPEKIVTFKDYFMYMMYPTLVYKKEYKRKQSINWGIVFWYSLLASCTLISSLVLFLRVNFPILMNHPPTSLVEFAIVVAEMMIPSVLIWVLLFVAIISCSLNVLAEITMFDDCTFEQDFWTVTQLEEFWKKWSSLIHEWMKRYIYKPLRSQGLPKSVALPAVFLFSAIWHELLFSVIFDNFAAYFFTMLLLQVPLIAINRLITNPIMGSIYVWVTLAIGHALIEVCYIQSWLLLHYNGGSSPFCSK